MNKKTLLALVLSAIFIAGCSNNKQLTVGSAVGGTAGALVGGMIGGMFGLLASGGGISSNSNAVVATGVILGGVTGGAAGVALGSGIQSAVEK